MASSSSEDFDHSIPEIVYECLSIIDGSSSKKDAFYVNCPLCKQLGKCFYCVECVRNGNFMHSKKKCYERFADKKVTKYKLDEEKARLLQRYENSFSKKKKIENLKLDIYKSKEKIRLLEASIKSCKESIIKDREKIKELKIDNSILESNRNHCISKLYDMDKRYKIKNMDLEKANMKFNSTQSALQKFIQHRTLELITHIFPITKVTSQSHKSSSDEGQFAELEEAQKTTYVKGQWVMTGSAMDDIQYSVVEPCIPNSGDYSAYTTWCTEHIQGISRDNLSALDKCQFDKAYGISAALAYTAQLVSILAFYMDAYVPKKCSFSDFCGHESSRTKFLHKVAKLNTNIISLCLTRGVDVSKINAHQTIQNLLLLLKSETGELESGSFDDMKELLESIEDSLSKDLLSVDESDSDDMEAEFVHISEEEEFLQVPDQASIDPVPAQSSLISSVFSLFKAAAGQK